MKIKLLSVIVLCLILVCVGCNSNEVEKISSTQVQDESSQASASITSEDAKESSSEKTENSEVPDDIGSASEKLEVNTNIADVEKIKASKTLVLLTYPDMPPFSYINNDGNVRGIDRDIAQLIANELDVELVVVKKNFSELLQALQDGEGDLVISSLSITGEREELVDFSEPYASTEQHMLVSSNNDTIKTMEDLSGKTVGVLSGSIGKKIANESSVQKMIISYDNIDELALDVKNEKIDAMIISKYIALWIESKDEGIKFVEEPVGETEQVAVAIRKGSDLMEYVNDGIAYANAEGQLVERTLLHYEDITPGVENEFSYNISSVE